VSLMAVTDTVALRGISITVASETEVVARVGDAIDRGEPGWVCPINTDVLLQCSRSPQLAALVSSASVVVADGMPLIWTSRLQGTPLPERVAGSSLIHTLCQDAGRHGRSVFLLGGAPGAADGAAPRLTDLHGVRVVGTHCPPFGFEKDAGQLEAIDAALRAAAPDIVFVGLGFPKQDVLIDRLRERFPYWFVSCGVSFSFVSGEIKRAPLWMQRFGLEWMDRMRQEPQRLYRRYVIDDMPFVARLLTGAVRARFAGSHLLPPAPVD
jgi:N-acetylglucosaminyldiphosphoundecaprenol N-acetyl-beta-D-mannosaminyltransferase